MILLIDIGNTRIKWASLVDGRLNAQAALVHEGLTGELLIDSMLKPLPQQPQRVLIANVAGARLGDLASACVKDHCNLDAQFVHATQSAGGVRNAYREPSKLGVDRWLAVIGAYALEGRAACVVCAGTAVTIDGVDSSGQHLGGVIVPGPDLMIHSLFRNTSDIAARAQGGEATGALFADNTRGAVEQGAVHALAALVERAVETMSAHINESPALILTGGASASIQSAVRTPLRCVPDLVLRGLAMVAQEPAGF